MPGSEHKYVEVTGDLGVVVEKKLLKHKKSDVNGWDVLQDSRQTFRSEQARHNELANIEWSEMKNFYTLTLRKSNHGDGM